MSTKRKHRNEYLKDISPVLENLVGPFSFGMFVRSARTTLGITQSEMAKKLGITKGTLCDIEKGRQLVSVTLAMKIAKKSGLSIDLAVQSCLQDQLAKAKFKKRIQIVA